MSLLFLSRFYNSERIVPDDYYVQVVFLVDIGNQLNVKLNAMVAGDASNYVNNVLRLIGHARQQLTRKTSELIGPIYGHVTGRHFEHIL